MADTQCHVPQVKPEEEEDPAVQAAEASAADRGDEDDVLTEPVSPAQRLTAKVKATFQKDQFPEDVGTITAMDITKNTG